MSISVVMSSVSYPHGFYGEINIGDGTDANGLILIGQLENGEVTGSCIIQDGSYDLIVLSSPEYSGKVRFYLCDEDSNPYKDDGKADETFDFKIFEVTKLDLNFDTALVKSCGCGNGLCDEKECSFCAIDCTFNECSGNGRCDVEVGEDCANSPEDCGICKYCGDGTCNNGETYSTCSADCGSCSNNNGGTSNDNSNGGSNGGSSTTSSQDNTDNQENKIPSIDELNKKESESTSRLTGAVIGFAESGLGIGITIGIIIILGGISVIVVRRKSLNKAK